MKFLLLASLVLAAVYVAESQHLPQVLVERARAIIHRAEADLHKHHSAGRQHLTKELEKEIEKVRHLEKELLAMEQHKHLELKKVLEVEEKLLHHENKLAEESAKIEHAHKQEQEGHHQKEHEKKEHEAKEQEKHHHQEQEAELYVPKEEKKEGKLPHELIERARQVIKFAEAELHKHHQAGRHHLTKEMEKEIEKVRVLERELMAVEQTRHLDLAVVADVEERLLHHENKLIEESVKIEHAHKKEQEEQHHKKEEEHHHKQE